MSRTHLAVGMAAAVTVAAPRTIEEAVPVIIGGAIGSVICDIDCRKGGGRKDTLAGRIIAAVIVVLALFMDTVLGAHILESAAGEGPYVLAFGAGLMAIVCFAAMHSVHRGFAHSLLAGALEALAVSMIFRQAVIPFAAAFLSHVVLDLLNWKPVRVLYPLKQGFCLRMFRSDRMVNGLCTVLGLIWLTAAVVINGAAAWR